MLKRRSQLLGRNVAQKWVLNTFCRKLIYIFLPFIPTTKDPSLPLLRVLWHNDSSKRKYNSETTVLVDQKLLKWPRCLLNNAFRITSYSSLSLLLASDFRIQIGTDDFAPSLQINVDVVISEAKRHFFSANPFADGYADISGGDGKTTSTLARKLGPEPRWKDTKAKRIGTLGARDGELLICILVCICLSD